MRVLGFMRKWFFNRRAWCALWSERDGAQLVEFAVVLPLLAVLVVGIADFGAGYALKDKLTNAARDAARIAVGQPDDLTNSQSTACNGVPCSVQSAATAALNYLTNAGVNVCGMTPSTSPTPGPGAFAWTYTSPSNCSGTTNTMSIVIERAIPFVVNGSDVFLTRVTIQHPFKWSFGSVIKLLIPSATYSTTLSLSSVAVMQNLN